MRARGWVSGGWRRLARVVSAGLAASLLPVGGSARASGEVPDSRAVERREERDHESPDRWITVGALFGSTFHDVALTDYQWSTSPRLGLGAQALVGRRGFAAGARLWTTRTEQTLGAPGGAPATTTVRGTSCEVVGQGRLGRVWGSEVLAVASVGWLHLGYHPDRVTVSSGGSPVVVEFAPLDEWIAGGGLGLRRRLAAHWSASAGVDHQIFRLKASHRDGNAIVEGYQSFGDWSARLELARVFNWR